MKINNIFLFCFILIIFSCNDSVKNDYPTYYRMYNDVMKYKDAGQEETALSHFQEAEKLVEYIPSWHYMEARNLAIRLKNCQLQNDYFQKAVTNGFEFKDEDLSFYLCEENGDYEIIRPQYDLAYKAMVDSIYQVDQNSRGSGKDFSASDSSNMALLLRYIKEKGYPSAELIGSESADHAFIVMLHFDDDIGNQIMGPIIDQAYDQGYISPQNYAWMVDRRRNWGPDELEPYYYQIPTKGLFELSDEERDTIEERRYSIGMEPLSDTEIVSNPDGSFSVTY